MRHTRRLWIVLVLNVGLVAALFVTGLSAHSLGVFAEGVDYLADAAAIGVSLLALGLAGRPPTPRRPQGYPAATTWAAAVNAGWLLALNLLVIAGAILRLVRGVHHVHGLPVLVVSGVAALVMIAGALILSGDTEHRGDEDEAEDLNLQAILLDTAADAAAAAGVATTGAVILATGSWFWLDPAAALVIAAVVSYHAITLLRQVSAALAAPVPAPGAPSGAN